MKNSHIDVTIDFREYGLHQTYDLRIPVQITIKQLLRELMDILNVERSKRSSSAIKVKTKGLVLADDDLLMNYPVTNGDVLTVLDQKVISEEGAINYDREKDRA
ncbi:EsaB/YukD family protein [Gracilibacillus kekensis]|uniref:Uncharacterized ubiquitin-like protein YukD n=1 Tax=Gracilibacillus kekensis TaxID=1027249 RepID=A0A1M7JQ78_9BACI|nr:EsaB/YukD family protein [Gracilibacillus kekensis]SHM55065.1 Uncharacterized ubiquitin-like protein YukD [Gracilibacillus kekensis]